MTAFVQTFVDEALQVEDLPLNEDERRRLVGDLLEETLGVGPLASLMADPAVTDILVNRPEQVYVERFGRLEKTDVRFRDVDHLVRIIQRIAARVGRRIDESSPMVDARLPDGSRVNATLPPVTLDSPTLSIRRFGRQRLRRSDLMQLGMFSAGHPRFSRCRGAGPQERADFRRHRLGEVDDARGPGRGHSRSRADRDRRGFGGTDPRPGARGADGDPSGEHRRPRADHRPRPGGQCPADAARPDHRGRSPQRRGPGHAAGHEHRATTAA